MMRPHSITFSNSWQEKLPQLLINLSKFRKEV